MISKISFHSFKNLTGEYKPSENLNILIGPNGWGKTNFLESIDYFSHLRSFRGLSDRELFSWDSPMQFWKIVIEIVRDPNRKILESIISFDPKQEIIKKKFFIDKTATSSNKFKKIIDTILYSPHNADIVSSAPETRRFIFNRWIGQVDSEYEETLREYKFVVKSRNKLLGLIKNGFSSQKELSYWNERMIDLGTVILSTRLDFLNDIIDPIKKYSNAMFAADLLDMRISYQSKCVEEDKVILAEKIEAGVEKERGAGLSLYGPHRDNFVFMLKDKPLRDFGSRGQQRLAGLVVVLSYYDYLKSKTQRSPILLFDDIMSELDKTHRENIEKELKKLEAQIFITSSEKKVFSRSFVGEANLLGD